MPRRRGRRGEGSVRPVRVGKRVRYQARWSVTEGGVRKRSSATFDYKADAEWWLRQAHRTGSAPDAELTLGQYLDRWLAGKRSLRASTKAQYRNHIETHIAPVIGGIPVAKLEKRHVEAFVEDRTRYVSDSTHRPLSPSTVRAILTTLRSALEAAVPREIPDNPAARVEAPRVEREPVRAVGVDESRTILAAVKGTWVEPIARFLFGSGLRIGEALSINQGDIDWKAGKVRIRRSKTQLRTLAVSGDALAALRLALADAPRRGRAEPVFFGPRRTELGQRDRMSRHSVSDALSRMAGLSAHGLRHAHATTRLELGHDIESIAAQLGHKNPTMTRNVYAHVTERRQRANLDELDEAVER